MGLVQSSSRFVFGLMPFFFFLLFPSFFWCGCCVSGEALGTSSACEILVRTRSPRWRWLLPSSCRSMVNKLDVWIFFVFCGFVVSILFLAGRGGEEMELIDAEVYRIGGRWGKPAAGIRNLASFCWFAAPESYEALFFGVHQQRTVADGGLRLASASYGRTANLHDLDVLVDLNLQAVMPQWRPSGAVTVRSRRTIPSGLVPGGSAAGRDSALWRRIGEEGADRRSGADCFSILCSRD
jgi:hypothetical protein